MDKNSMEAVREKRLSELQEEGIPGALEWSDINVPSVRPYIEKCNEELEAAIQSGSDHSFHVALEKVERAWERLFYLIAKEECKGKTLKDLDMDLFARLEEEDAIRVDRGPFGEFILYPKTPRRIPEGVKWLTAEEAESIRTTPALQLLMKDFGAWFKRDDPSGDIFTKEIKAASLARAKKIRAEGGGLHMRRKKGGWEIWE